MLKLSNSFEVDLVPGTSQDLDKKSFSWTVKELSGTSIDFDFTFENPEYISMGDRADYMNVKFHNTDVYMVPKDSDKAAAPDGYQISIKLPPQKQKTATWYDKFDNILSACIVVLFVVNTVLSVCFGCSAF